MNRERITQAFDRFRQQSTRIATLDAWQAIPSRLPHGVATFTFDDFPESAYVVAGQMIESAGARATYFASAEFIDKTIDGVDYFSSDLLRDLESNGHEIGCHGAQHVRLGARGASFAVATTRRNATLMRDILGRDFRMVSFAYPFGDVSLRVKRVLAGQFAFCRGIQPGYNQPFADLAQLRVVSLESRHWDEARVRAAIKEAHRRKRWLIFLSHDVSESPTPFGSTPAMIARTLDMLSDAEIPVMTLKAAGALAAFGRSDRALRS